MCMFLKNFKNLLTSIAVLFILMISLTPCFGEEYYNAKEQYTKDILTQLAELYTPEKYFPQKEMDLRVRVTFLVLPDGSITDISTYYDYEDLSHSLLNPIHNIRLKKLLIKHEQYVLDIFSNFKAKPFPEKLENWPYLELQFTFTYLNKRFRKPVFQTYLDVHYYYIKINRTNYFNRLTSF